jgi:hypothetical protein
MCRLIVWYSADPSASIFNLSHGWLGVLLGLGFCRNASAISGAKDCSANQDGVDISEVPIGLLNWVSQ